MYPLFERYRFVKRDIIPFAKTIERNNATACGVIEINNSFVTIPTEK
jgi:hypothetical protein